VQGAVKVFAQIELLLAEVTVFGLALGLVRFERCEYRVTVVKNIYYRR
jgi:hypothetical protein